MTSAHFVGVHSSFSLIEPEGLSTKGNDTLAFFKGLPDLRLHKDPLEVSLVMQEMKSKCSVSYL